MDELLQAGRSVILSTNALQFLDHARVTRIIVMKDGRIAEEGTYKELMARKNSLFAKYITVINETGLNPGELDEEDLLDPSTSQQDQGRRRSSRRSSRISLTDVQPLNVKKKLMTEEARAVGHVKLGVYLSWAEAAGGYWVPFIITLFFGLVEGINVLTKWWLTYWSSHGEQASQMWFLGIYALINASSVVAGFLCFLCVVLFGLKASRKVNTLKGTYFNTTTVQKTGYLLICFFFSPSLPLEMFYELLDVAMRAPMSFFGRSNTVLECRCCLALSSSPHTSSVRLQWH